jgi:RNA polymerase sigma-70 factor (ECF subfamily)
MQEYVDRFPDSLTAVADELDAEFERLLVESSSLAFRVAYGVLRQREDAEDVAQEAFIRAHRHFRRLRDRASFRAWLVRLTWRLALDRQRADRRRLSRDGEHNRAVAPPARSVDPAIANERAEKLWQAIDALPETLRLPIVLAGIEGHDVREIASLLGVPDGTVKSRLFHAREKIKESLKWMTPSSTGR